MKVFRQFKDEGRRQQKRQTSASVEKKNKGKKGLVNDKTHIEKHLQYTGAGIDTERVAFA
jgi:hypothetical protein